MELETVHLAVLTFTAIAIIYADHMGFEYFTGKRQVLEGKLIMQLHTMVSIGLSLMIMSGVLLALPMWKYLLVEPIFYVKMWFVLVLVLNGWAIGKISHLTHDRAFSELPQDTQRMFLVSGALSFIGWVGAAIIGFFFL